MALEITARSRVVIAVDPSGIDGLVEVGGHGGWP
jgi:hypothetical protein